MSPALRDRLAPFTERIHGGIETGDPQTHDDLVTIGKRIAALEELFQIEWCDSCGGYIDANETGNQQQRPTSAAFPTPPEIL